jgi:chemosensory pili system protein ChpA (sensor histidine kinase/response regulator)
MRAPGEDPPVVLLVDDNKDILEGYAEILRGDGFTPITASGGADALELAFRMRPDVIVIDMWMPELDGFQTTRALRADERTRDTPIIGFTSLGYSKRKAEEAGCNALLRKSVAPEELVATVWKFVPPRE